MQWLWGSPKPRNANDSYRNILNMPVGVFYYILGGDYNGYKFGDYFIIGADLQQGL